MAINPYNRSIVERRRRNISRVDDMTAKDTTVHGRTLIVGLGEIIVDLVFPVFFSNKPIFSYGADLDDEVTQEAQAGRFPTLNATVISWTTVRRVEGAFDGYYTGCAVALKVGGYSNSQRLGFNWTFREQAIRNPGRTDIV